MKKYILFTLIISIIVFVFCIAVNAEVANALNAVSAERAEANEISSGESLWMSFKAFNQNGWSYLVYAVSNNLWYLLIALAIVISIIIHIKEEIIATVRDEQRAL